MRPKGPGNRDLPPRMIRRVRKLKSGKVWVGYYYDGRDENGRRKEIPLGGDLDLAKIEWAKLDAKPVPKTMRTLGEVFDRYEREIIPAKATRTQRDNLLSLKQLRQAFAGAPVDAVTSQVIAQYRDARTAKVRANREISLLSHVYNIAREWGITEKNPAAGVRKNKETPRDYYARDEVWKAVYSKAPSELRDAMDLAYLTGQRPSDVLGMREPDIQDGFLLVDQGKTSKKLRIRLAGSDGATNALGTLVDRLKEQRKRRQVRGPYLITTQDGRRLTSSMLRNRFDEARRQAIAQALEVDDEGLAAAIRMFQFRDIRPKAASEIDDLGRASKLLGHTDKRITETVYRRVGEVVDPTR